jgi:hypothetical protein
MERNKRHIKHMPLSGNTPRRRGPPPDTGPSIEEAIGEAQTRSLDFPATERAIYVKAMVKRVQELRTLGRTISEIKDLLPEFHRDFPYLFEMVTENPDFDQASLKTMLAMLERMGQGSMNHHQATVVVGQRLAEKYIKPGNQ